jgi:ATP phosphoribosyltransferase
MMAAQNTNILSRKNSSPAGNCKFAIPKKGRLYEKCVELLKGSGIVFRREDRLDVALCVGLPITLIFLPASDIAKFVGEGNVDIGITGWDVVKESQVDVERVMDLGFGKCKLCVQAPVEDEITDVSTLAGGRIVTSFPDLTKEFFKPFDEAKGVVTNVRFVGGSVEAACGLGLADAVVDLVETGTTMRVRIYVSIIYWCWKAQSNRFQLFLFTDRLLDSRLSMTFLRLRLSLLVTNIPSMLIL